MIHFEDYHRTIVGYHGTRLSVTLDIINRRRPFDAPENEGDWLGRRIYFWEYAPRQAEWWAGRIRRLKKWDEPIAILGLMIRLGNCLDLLDPLNIGVIKAYHEDLRRKRLSISRPMPEINETSEVWIARCSSISTANWTRPAGSLSTRPGVPMYRRPPRNASGPGAGSTNSRTFRSACGTPHASWGLGCTNPLSRDLPVAKFRSELPKTAMNRLLERGLKRLRRKSLLESIQLQVRAKLLTQEEADEIQARFTPEQLAARPEPKRPKAATSTTPPTSAS